MLLYWVVQRKQIGPTKDKRDQEEQKLGRKGGFTLLFESRYILLIAVLLLLLNLVNTTGEFILGSKVVEEANKFVSSDPAFDKEAGLSNRWAFKPGAQEARQIPGALAFRRLFVNNIRVRVTRNQAIKGDTT